MSTTHIASFFMAITMTVSAPQFSHNPTVPLSEDLQQVIHYECLAAPEVITSEVVYAIIEHESGFNEIAVNVNGNGSVDYGYGQINEINWEWLSEEGIDVFEPKDNIKAIVRILSIYAEKGYTLDEVLAAYARGESGMLSGRGFWFADNIAEIMDTQSAWFEQSDTPEPTSVAPLNNKGMPHWPRNGQLLRVGGN